MTGSVMPWRSAFDAAEWAGVQESLLQGLVHAANNRVAALSGISQLYEAQIATSDEGMEQLKAELEKLRVLMNAFRAVLAGRGVRREPVRMGEALQLAAAVLAHHLAARQARFDLPAESGDVEPVLLWSGDALRFATLACLAVNPDGPGALVTGSLGRVGEETVVTLTTPGNAEQVLGRAEFRMLQAAAEKEGGSAQCGAAAHGEVCLTLALPGLTKATARR